MDTLSSYQLLMLMITLASVFGSGVLLLGKQLQVIAGHKQLLENHNNLIQALVSELRSIKENHYLLSHQEAREFLHSHPEEEGKHKG